jgi:hypothetical protein
MGINWNNMTHNKNYCRTVLYTISAYKTDKFWSDRITVTLSKGPLSYILMLVCRIWSFNKHGNNSAWPGYSIFCVKLFVPLLSLSSNVPK